MSILSSSVVLLEGDIDKEQIQNVKNGIRKAFFITDHFKLRMKSNGGKIDDMNTISGFLYYFRKYKNLKIITEAIDIRSAALFLFIYGDERVVTPESIGKIHLPTTETPNSPVREKAIELLIEKTKLNRKDIVRLEGKELNGWDLLKYGIANKLVESFD